MNVKKMLTAIGLALASVIASADLARQGPVVPAHGFPAYYQDFAGMALDICLPNAQELTNGTCLLFPTDVPNPGNLNFAVPANFPEEAFWFNASTVVPLDTAVEPDAVGDARMVLALEAAFGGGAVAANDQIAFSRVRYRFIAPSEGEYTVITPYTRDTFTATAGELIFNTLDIGIACPQGDFTCAMKGKTAPFLRAADAPGGNPLPPVVLPGGKTYLADPNADSFVTDGPEGHSFIIRGPNGDIVNTDTFNLMGRVHTDPLPSFTTLDRVSYARSAGSSQVDVFATSISGLNQIPAPRLQLLAPDMPGAIFTQDANLPTKYHAQVKPNGSDLPANVFVTNLTDVPATVITGKLADLVRVTEASYDSKAAGGTLTVKATSSDEVVVPNLTFIGSNGVNYGSALAGATFTATGVGLAPDTVTVNSAAGGSVTAAVSTDAVATAATVTANNDTPLTADLGAINVLANDAGVATTAIVRIVRQPEHGTATVSPDKSIAYSARGVYSGPDNLTYYIDNNVAGSAQLSNIASVDFDVSANNRPPVAVADTASVTQNASVTIDAIANDTDPDNDPLTISDPLIAAPVVGTVSIVDGKVVYSVPAGAPVGPKTITYTLSDGTLTSTGTITVTVQAAETVAVPTAQYSTRDRSWQFRGTVTPVPAGVEVVTARFYAGPATTQTAPGVTGVANEARFIGQAAADTAGRFRYGPAVSTVIPIGTTFHVKTSRGTVRNFTHTVRN